MTRTTYHIAHMDCAAEEQLVRMGLADVPGIERLEFDLGARELHVLHSGDTATISSVLDGLGLRSRMEEEVASADSAERHAVGEEFDEKGPLAWALAINATLFVAELIAGLIAGSMGLLADGLDMLADAFVYALSLAAVGGTMIRKKQLARWSGYLQLGLAVLGLIEVTRRFVSGEGLPDVPTMIIVAAIALIGNAATLAILSKAKRGEAHVEASWIFTSNDIKVNILVIASALLVTLLASNIPDLLTGALIFVIVANGARRILALAR